MDDTSNNLHVVLKQTSKFDGNKTDDFLEWSSKLCASLSIYNRAIFTIMQGQERPSETDDTQATACAAWDVANQDRFSILLRSTDGSNFFVVRRFEGTTLEGGAGTWTSNVGSSAREVRKEFAQSDSRGACQDEQYANALRT